jgi:hypothetical protein
MANLLSCSDDTQPRQAPVEDVNSDHRSGLLSLELRRDEAFMLGFGPSLSWGWSNPLARIPSVRPPIPGDFDSRFPATFKTATWVRAMHSMT